MAEGPKYTSDDISVALKARIPECADAIVTDLSDGCGNKFNAVVVSPVFAGKSSSQRVVLAGGSAVLRVHAYLRRRCTLRRM